MSLLSFKEVYDFVNAPAIVCANDCCLSWSPCAQFVDRFLHNLKGRELTEPIRLVTFVETAVGLLNLRVNWNPLLTQQEQQHKK